MNDIPIVEDLLLLNILLYEIAIVEENVICDLAQRSVQENENTLRLMRYNNHICYVGNINALFQSFHCPTLDTFFNRISNLEQNSITCKERVKNLYPRKVYQIRKTLFDNLDSFAIK